MIDTIKLLELYVKGDTGKSISQELKCSRQRLYQLTLDILRPWHAVMRALNLYYTPKRQLDARDHAFIDSAFALINKFNSND